MRCRLSAADATLGMNKVLSQQRRHERKQRDRPFPVTNDLFDHLELDLALPAFDGSVNQIFRNLRLHPQQLRRVDQKDVANDIGGHCAVDRSCRRSG